MEAIPVRLQDADVQRIARAVADILNQPAAPTPPAQPELLREAAVAELCGVSAAFLKKLRLAGQISAHSGRPVLYSRGQLQAVVDHLAQRRAS